MKRSLLLTALAATAQAQRPQQRAAPQPIPTEPPHVMSRAKWERMQREQSQQK